MATTGRKPSCLCGTCPKCKHRLYMRDWYRRKTPKERREWIAKRDPETVRANDRKRYYRDAGKRMAWMREWAKRNPEKVRAAKQKWIEANPEKRNAQQLVRRYIKAGKMERLPCGVCGAEPTHGHHDDYSKPLDVRWLCSKHHREHHRRYEVAA